MYRTVDGTCNNFNQPWWGSVFQPLKRFLPPAYEDGKYFNFHNLLNSIVTAFTTAKWPSYNTMPTPILTEATDYPLSFKKFPLTTTTEVKKILKSLLTTLTIWKFFLTIKFFPLL